MTLRVPALQRVIRFVPLGDLIHGWEAHRLLHFCVRKEGRHVAVGAAELHLDPIVVELAESRRLLPVLVVQSLG